MLSALLDARFYSSQADAKTKGPDDKLNGGTKYRLRVVEVIRVSEFVCAVEWAADYAGPPEDHTKVPDLPYAYLRGGCICAIRWKLWDADKGRVLLGLEVLDRM